VSLSASASSDAHAERLDQILRDYQAFRSHVVPLCAAETPVSDFVRGFMTHPIHEKYAMGGPLAPAADNFVGAEHVLSLHELTIDLCRDVFGADYADPRPLSGTSAVTSLLMTLSEPGQRIMLQTSASGGHASMAPICRRLGLEIIDVPYDFDRLDIDVDACRQLVATTEIDFVLFSPSDLIYPPRLRAVGFGEATTLIYDATQTLGLIASGHLPSPLDDHPRMVISAGTHKTLPGPSSGLLLTRHADIAHRLDRELSPKFIRHSHPHHTAALCASLIEQRAIGEMYSNRIREHAGTLSRALALAGVEVVQDGGRVSETHQVFVHVPPARLESAYARAMAAGITLNMKRKPLFRTTGLRLGVQEIARYRWTAADVQRLGGLIAMLLDDHQSVEALRTVVGELAALNTFAPDMVICGSPLKED
jgi:glycine hydroxymethyltransferase